MRAPRRQWIDRHSAAIADVLLWCWCLSRQCCFL
jgi:hypothetical protein